uniref:Uncharacterized protein n=1 Tax=Chromera velia CCMP2878 TaxID=1169474 RepID=A0A0G4I3M9_9ALVE|eukprot:Cvel_10709.t1-p1 / transcript=Cvel_10709.t1 / gene=Cvel_10709 / organism=Chromera_velia_CCMP2878 / gene_product=hypothetical protein / transcript_product=hypothetical protein / location=Cvel_scaffold651:58515-58877(+) / protein_length=121 / sequence_SO=supercontig / SO=protein_coding / is_pseudo=false
MRQEGRQAEEKEGTEVRRGMGECPQSQKKEEVTRGLKARRRKQWPATLVKQHVTPTVAGLTQQQQQHQCRRHAGATGPRTTQATWGVKTNRGLKKRQIVQQIGKSAGLIEIQSTGKKPGMI